jgi:hypothetical protein
MNEWTVAFYNVENLFDVKDDPLTADHAFTPSGVLDWDLPKYWEKIEHLADVLFALAPNNELPSFVGLAEVENEKVVRDLINHRLLRTGNYRIVHAESIDSRGIDVAFLYNPAIFEHQGHQLLTIDRFAESSLHSRDIMHVWGIFPDGQKAHFFINHWPSRRNGQLETAYKRAAAAKTLDAALRENVRFESQDMAIVMGDFNDEPQDESLQQILNAQEDKVQSNPLINLAWRLKRAEKGTVSHKSDWYMFDQILVDRSSTETNRLGYKISKMEMYDDARVMFTSKNGIKKPSRTYVGSNYKGGFSDHLAVYARIVKR